ncbi:MAG: Trk family potassium uptake protein [Clostridiales bacterium]|uniref:TrkH family potassium uptake protein n=1 Tax=Clostridium sp. N3C TaxID=1776758 RepID=UPI00092E0D3D|nr:TrkH family potassium uptake protein [Clostridium sp. N3C]NLZ48963.1 Trk family potassium uptake protein [Clostridiales bacterium]SCN21449.1 Ktr system potassium uptake protein B [Clostridium sp. N3C]
MNLSEKKGRKLSPVQILCLGFVTLILIGALLLSLPISSAKGQFTSFIDSLFTATSSLCVTGFVNLDTGSYWSYFGKTLIIILVQIGGIGFMSFATMLAIILGKKITLRDRLVLQESMNTFNLQGLVKMEKYILSFTFIIETIGALVLSTQFIPSFGLSKGIYYSFWHSISAFCNGGFDLFGTVDSPFISLIGWRENPIVIVTLTILIIVGGLGFLVWADIYNYKVSRKLSLHSKVVIIGTLILIFGGAFFIYILECNNPLTLKDMSMVDKIINSFFASVSHRTAGMSTIITADMKPASRLLTIILMFIGGSSGSTAGGIKITTVTIIIMTIVCTIKGKEETEIFKKRVSKEQVLKSFIIATLGFSLIILATVLLSIIESNSAFSLECLFFEATSALTTAGLSLGLTPHLSSLGKVLIIILMYIGRVGPLTVALSLGKNKKKNLIRYPEGKILIG